MSFDGRRNDAQPGYSAVGVDVEPEVTSSDLRVNIAHVDTTARCVRHVERRVVRVLHNHTHRHAQTRPNTPDAIGFVNAYFFDQSFVGQRIHLCAIDDGDDQCRVK